VGLVTYPGEAATIDELLERADEAMYRSKRSGRDRVTGVPVMDTEGAQAEGAQAEGAPAGGRGRPV
jgi:predicted signal transduction protein with EAL and GGDEF domain